MTYAVKEAKRQTPVLTDSGWINNFKYANIKTKLEELDGWLRNRLRYCIWHHWKKPERKRKNLIRLGIEAGMAYAWSRSRMGGWAIAQLEQSGNR